jgi:hypothetical protein
MKKLLLILIFIPLIGFSQDTTTVKDLELRLEGAGVAFREMAVLKSVGLTATGLGILTAITNPQTVVLWGLLTATGGIIYIGADLKLYTISEILHPNKFKKNQRSNQQKNGSRL